jgi:peptidoglycan/LPS O-acetylase OafA/YrhL
VTINDYLKRRIRRLFVVIFVVWLCIPISMTFYGGGTTKGPGVPWPVAVFFPIFGVIALMLARTKCPRCKGSMYGLVGAIAFPTFKKQRVCYCPYCGVNLDEPTEPPANPK